MNPPLSLSRSRPFELFLSLNPYNETQVRMGHLRIDVAVPLVPQDLIPGLSLRAGLGVSSDFLRRHRYEAFAGLRYSFSDLVHLQTNLAFGNNLPRDGSDDRVQTFLEPQIALQVSPWEALGFFLQTGYAFGSGYASNVTLEGGLQFNLESVRRYVSDDSQAPPPVATRTAEENTQTPRATECSVTTTITLPTGSDFQEFSWLESVDSYEFTHIEEGLAPSNRNAFHLELRSIVEKIDEVYQVRQGIEILSSITRLANSVLYDIQHQSPNRAANLSNLNGRMQIYLNAVTNHGGFFAPTRGTESEIRNAEEWINIPIRDLAVARLNALLQQLPAASPVAQNARRLLVHFQTMHPRDYDLRQRQIDTTDDIEGDINELQTRYHLNSDDWRDVKRSLLNALQSNLTLIPII